MNKRMLSTFACGLLLLGACGGETPAPAAEALPAVEAPAAADAPAAAAEAPAAPAETACARVAHCCEVMGAQYGGGSQRSCQEKVTAGDEEACVAYLALNAQINGTDGHPLAGRMILECMPAE